MVNRVEERETDSQAVPPSISVVIPSFNQGQYLEEAILSVIGQYYPRLELLVIDGGSTDNSVEILEKYSPHISYWHSRKDKGQADAINHGMSLSSGEVLCWLNSDDMYLPGTLLDVGRRFSGRTEKSHLLYGGTIFLGQDHSGSTCEGHQAAPFDAFSLTYYAFVIQPSTFWTRELWKEAGNIDVRFNYVLDWEWFIRASKVTDFEPAPRFYSLYRFHSGHKTGQGGAERQQEIIEVVKKYSSDYWAKTFVEVQKHYNSIRLMKEILSRLGITKDKAILPFFFPKIWFRLNAMRDFHTVLDMYR